MEETQETYENPDKQPEQKTDEKINKPSKLWYLLPILLGIIGGLIGFLIIRSRDKKTARNLLIVGIIVLIIQVVSVGLIYTLTVSQFVTPEIMGENNGQEISNQNEEQPSQNLENNNQQEIMSRLSKAVMINSVECVSGNPGTLKFTLKSIGTSTIEASEIFAAFDSENVPLTIDPMPAGSISKEISFSKSISQGAHELIVSAPAGDVEKTVTCV